MKDKQVSQLNTRCTELFKELDMKFNGTSYVGTKENNNEDFNVHYTEIQCDSPHEWEVKMHKMKKEYTKRKENVQI